MVNPAAAAAGAAAGAAAAAGIFTTAAVIVALSAAVSAGAAAGCAPGVVWSHCLSPCASFWQFLGKATESHEEAAYSIDADVHHSVTYRVVGTDALEVADDWLISVELLYRCVCFATPPLGHLHLMRLHSADRVCVGCTALLFARERN